jgi:isomerase DpgB
MKFGSTPQLPGRTIVQLDVHAADSLSPALVARINGACDEAENAGASAVVLVRIGHSSGTPEPELLNVNLINAWERALRRLERLNALTVSVIDGQCHGLEAAVMLSTDYRCAGSELRFSLVSRGADILPGMSLYRLTNEIGVAGARRLALFGAELSAEQAQQIGLVDAIAADPLQAVLAFVAGLPAHRTGDLSIRRRLILEAPTLSYDDSLGSHLAACDRVVRAMRGRDSEVRAQA